MEKIRYPIYFTNGICPHCGKKGKLKYIDIYGNTVKDVAIYTITKIVCSNCKTEYYPKWINNDSNKMIITTTGRYAINDMAEKIEDYSLKNRRYLE